MHDELIRKSSIRYNKKNHCTMKTSLSFIKDLKKNNNKEWFHANRPRYDEARAEFLALIESIVSEIRLFDSHMDADGITLTSGVG